MDLVMDIVEREKLGVAIGLILSVISIGELPAAVYNLQESRNKRCSGIRACIAGHRFRHAAVSRGGKRVQLATDISIVNQTTAPRLPKMM